MKPVNPRPISASEAAIVIGALERAAVESADRYLHSVGGLVVTGICECGCGSVSFCEPSCSEHRLADGVGFLPSGQRVDVLIWAKGSDISRLEIVDYGQANGALPIPESVTSWDRAGGVQQAVQGDGPASGGSAP